MKVVILCSATKDRRAESFALNGRRVEFVAHPEFCGQDRSHVFVRPDDVMPSTSMTWRGHLLAYNARDDNPDGLLPSGSLYSHSVDGRLLDSVGSENLYILSAGWGLVRSDSFLPDYDITFSAQAERSKRRTQSDSFDDFAQLTQAGVVAGETVYFFGGKTYLPLYYQLTGNLKIRKVIYYAATQIPRKDGFDYISYGRSHTNWHYSCAQEFLADRIAR